MLMYSPKTARILVGQLDRRAGEANIGGIGQRITHITGETIDKVVLAAVGFIGNDNDIGAVRELGIAISLFFGKELLDGGENNATGINLQFLAQIGATFGLDGRLAE
jgi:hypothetical protein